MDSKASTKWIVSALAIGLGCAPEPGAAPGTDTTTGGDDPTTDSAPTTMTEGPTSPTTSASASTTATTDNPTDEATASETGECAIGSELCPCTGGGACDPGLVCVDGTCVDEDCAIGAIDCPCTNGGSCNPGLVCEDEICVDDMPTTDSESSSSDGGTETDTGEPADLDDWTRRRAILIDNPNDVDLVDHQVMIDMDWDDDMNANLSDLRFTDASGAELLPHWVEEFVAPVSLRAWVRVPQIDAMDVGTIYVWYGNENAVDAEDPEATFNFWDDFDGAALDEAVWTATDDVVVDGGVLSTTEGSVYSVEPVLTQPGYVVEARMRWPDHDEGAVAASGLSIGESQGDVGVGARQTVYGYPQAKYSQAFNDAAVIFADDFGNVAFTEGTYGYVGIGHGDGIVRFSLLHIHAFNFFHELDGLFAGDYYFGLGDPGGSVAAGVDGADLDVDHVLARRFHREALETFAGAEEDV